MQCVITSEPVEALGWLDILQIPIVSSVCSWITHRPGRLRPDKIEGGGVRDEDGVEACARPGGVVEAGAEVDDEVEVGVEGEVDIEA